MCKIVEDLVEWGVNEQQTESAKYLIQNTDLSFEQIARANNLPIETVETLAQEMNPSHQTT